MSLIGYDTTGRVTSITGAAPSNGASRPAHRYTYTSAPTTTTDGETRVTQDGVSTPTGYSGKVTFNAALRATSSTDGQGRVSTTEYNGKDQLVRAVDPAGRVSTTVYDYADRTIASYGPAPATCFTGHTPTVACQNTVPTGTTAYDQGLTGLHVDWYNNSTLAQAPVARSLGLGAAATAPLTVDWGAGAPVAGVNADNFSLRATGYLTFPTTGTYNFTLNVDDGARSGSTMCCWPTTGTPAATPCPAPSTSRTSRPAPPGRSRSRWGSTPAAPA
ncbi:MAG TPA: PA14 domain-containing protein [Nakamurella sp.]